MFLFCLVFVMSLCASVYMCFVVTCWERADLLALVCGVCCEFVTFPLVSWVRCGTWLYRFLIFAPLLTLENVQSAKYLGITISDNIDWGKHISDISSKATKTLGFLRRNLAFAPRSTKEVAYKTLVRPKLEYAAPIWSPYSKLQIKQVEKV